MDHKLNAAVSSGPRAQSIWMELHEAPDEGTPVLSWADFVWGMVIIPGSISKERN